MSAGILSFPIARSADLTEALDAVWLLHEALIQAMGDHRPTGLQIAALAVVAGLQEKHRSE